MCNLSLFSHCEKCGAICCKASSTIGAPILSEEEARALEAQFGNDSVESVRAPNGEIYYITADLRGYCAFLQGNQCLAQQNKPMDCLCYPVKAVYGRGKVVFVIDDNCPAVPCLTDDFIGLAKEVALSSIKRFSPVVFNHWLENFVGWVNNARILF